MKPKIQKSKDPTKNSRSALKSAVALKIESIRPFILSPVMKGIDNKEPLEYLTEMRQVCLRYRIMKAAELITENNFVHRSTGGHHFPEPCL